MTKTDPSMLVLASLADGDKHGYAIMMDIKAFANVEVGPGTLYGVITRLEERGLIRPVSSDDRRQPYHLTAAGRKHLEEAIGSLETIVRVGSHRLKHA
jgi:DNA-binding PadR family transcriptional regulator